MQGLAHGRSDGNHGLGVKSNLRPTAWTPTSVTANMTVFAGILMQRPGYVGRRADVGWHAALGLEDGGELVFDPLQLGQDHIVLREAFPSSATSTLPTVTSRWPTALMLTAMSLLASPLT